MSKDQQLDIALDCDDLQVAAFADHVQQSVIEQMAALSLWELEQYAQRGNTANKRNAARQLLRIRRGA